MKEILIDIETFSPVDLEKSGMYRYTEAPDFEVLLFGYSVDFNAINAIDIINGESVPQEIVNALTDDAVIKWSYNAAFERVCLSRWLRDQGISLDPFADNHSSAARLGQARFLNPASWRCLMVWSAYMGLPLSLEASGAVLGLENQKLKEGKDLIRYFCKPCAPTAINSHRTRNLPEHAPDKWKAFKAYNRRDVEAELSVILFPIKHRLKLRRNTLETLGCCGLLSAC
jgi:DNA polymerase